MSHLMHRFLRFVANRLPCRTIEGVNGPYLEKYLVFRTSPGKEATCLHLHHFLRSDEDPEPHNHPWTWAVSLILATGYVEQRIDEGTGELLDIPYKPFSVNVIGMETRHRVEIPEGQTAWTLFLSGPVVKSWGFFRRVGSAWQYTHWKEFVRAKGLVPLSFSGSMLKPSSRRQPL